MTKGGTGRGGRAGGARRAAFDVLRAVDERQAWANLVLPREIARYGLSGRDAAFVTEIVQGVLRGRGTYDAVLAACVDRPLAQVNAPVLDVVRIGAHQLLATRVPPHAAVSATVDLAREVVGAGTAKFVNAVLRRVGERPVTEWLARVAPADADPVDRLAVTHSHPRWVVRAFADALDGDLTETQAALAADNTRPLVTLAARPGRCTVDELVALGAVPGRWSPMAAVLPGGDPAALAPVADGRARVQDEGSQLAALALTRAPLAGPDGRWLDVAAGPGGKAVVLAEIAAGRGARVLASEVRPRRAALVAGALAGGGGGNASTVVADGAAPAWRAGVFDRVLADVPCTGLGSLRRRPEARWRRSPADVERLRPLQEALLVSALDAARPGGVVAYVTCSPHLSETRGVVEAVLARRRTDGGSRAGATGEGTRASHGDSACAEWVDARPLLDGVPLLGGGPDVQLWPHRHGTDAMYLALLRRK